MASVEERRNMHKAVLYVVLSITAVILLIFLGIPGLAKLAGFLGTLKSSSQAIEKNDTTPPAPPRLETLPEATNKVNLEIKGTTEEGATVILLINNSEEEVVADKNGEFTFTTSLNKGRNTVSVRAKDPAGNESVSSDVQSVVFDNEKPLLEISSPEDGKNYYGSMQRQVVIEGTTEADVSITINDRFVSVDDNGVFSFATTLQEGDNNFMIKAADKAGNDIEKGITLHFWK